MNNIVKPNNFYNQKQFFMHRVSKNPTKVVVIPTIIVMKERDCGVQVRTWGIILAFWFWQWEFVFGSLQNEMFNQKLNFEAFCVWFRNVYKKDLNRNQLIDFLERNREIKAFIEKTGFQYHYPRILLGRMINQNYQNL